MTTVLVTGGAGFIGSHFVRMLLETKPDVRVRNLDALTYAGVKATVDELQLDPRHTFVEGDIRDQTVVDDVMNGVDVVAHFAAESMVDRSIHDGRTFLETNVLGTDCLLNSALRYRVSRFLHVSTDEVYGSISEGYADESHPLNPSSAYSASKAAAALLVRSYYTTHGLPILITRCTNNYGPYQFPEKLIPLFMTNLIDGRNVPLYGDGSNRRDWLYVTDHCEALMCVLDRGTVGETYNIGADNQVSNLELTTQILEALDLPKSRIELVEDRPGHDFRYAVDSSRVRSIGWSPAVSLRDGLNKTLRWYLDNQDWWRPLKESGR